MLKRYCDICGSPMGKYDTYYVGEPGYKLSKVLHEDEYGNLTLQSREVPMDICPHCMDSLGEWVKSSQNLHSI